MAERRGHSTQGRAWLGAACGRAVDRVVGDALGDQRGVRCGVRVAVAVALMVGLAACTGPSQAEPTATGGPGSVTSPSPSSTTAPTPTASPSPTAIPVPIRPAAMDRADADGAIAAATYFIALYSYVYATGELDAWQAISDPSCVFCAGLTTDVQAATAAGTRFAGGGLTITSSNATPGAAASIFRVDLNVSQAPFEAIDSAGSVTSTSAGTKAATITTVLEHLSSGWVVRAANADVLLK